MGSVTTLEVIRDGTPYDISDEIAYLHLGNADFGMPPIERRTIENPQGNGATDYGFRLQPRIVSLRLFGLGDSQTDYFARREQLLRLFRPTNDPLRLRFTLEDGRQRECRGHLTGGLGFDSQQRRANNQREVIQVYCPDPTWYDPAGDSIDFALSISTSPFEIPLAIPWGIGQSGLDQTKAIDYAGTWQAFPVILVTGPVTDLVITNESTGEKLDFTGTVIASGETYTIDLRYRDNPLQKLIYKDGDENDDRIADLSNDSDLFDFHLEPTGMNPTETNTIRVAGTNANENTRVVMQYTTRYLGV